MNHINYLQNITNNFSIDGLKSYFRFANRNFRSASEETISFDQDYFTDGKKIGSIKLNSDESIVIYSFKVKSALSERSSKRRQYENSRKILRLSENLNYSGGIFVYYDDSGNFRFSFMYPEYTGTRREWSPYKRYTYYVGRGEPNRTFIEYVGGCKYSSIKEIKESFSVEKVTKEFFQGIAKLFTILSGGKRKIGKEKLDEKGCLKLPDVPAEDEVTRKNFAVRLLGRLLFCWFLKKKKSAGGIPLLSDDILSSNAVNNNKDYYHNVVEKLFFEVLNTPFENRRDEFKSDLWKSVPFLNGGLFEPSSEDFYKLDASGNSRYINTLKIPDKWFKDLFQLFENYNFTIDESSSLDVEVSIDPEMLGRIFENLLAEINPDTGESARKATGSYYTPREIVDYMVNESIFYYLTNRIGDNETLKEKIRALIFEKGDVNFDRDEKEKLLHAIDNIKILDPACGSGAFPIGALLKLTNILHILDPKSAIWKEKKLNQIKDNLLKKLIEEKLASENWEYVHKLRILQNSIFGVDIQPIAVEISKLRCFLSLIVDEKIDDNKPNRGIEPLPNLEFKFVCANTLIGLPEFKIPEQGELGSNSLKLTDELKELREKYLNTQREEKSEIKNKFLEKQKILMTKVINWMIYEDKDFAKKINMLSSWDPFSNKPSEWFDPEWMFGVNDGFDIVIANPPYIGEKGHKEIFREVKKGSLGKFYLGKMDYFYFFFHASLNIGKDKAVVAFITTNYYPTATGAKKLRKDFKERAIIKNLINFNELKIFKSALGQHNIISILQKGYDKNALAQTCITQRYGLATSEVLQQILNSKDSETQYYKVAQKDLYDGDECYIRLTGVVKTSDNPIQKILDKIKSQGVNLGSICNVNQGIVTGADKVSKKHIEKYKIRAEVGDGIFVLSEKEVSNLNLSKKEKEILKPWFKNSDIFIWGTSLLTTEELIYADKRLSNLVNNKLKEHLRKFKKILDDSTDNSPYLHRPRDIDFESAKIVAPQRSPKNTFGYNEIPWYASADVYFITERDKSISLKYVLALLNSKLYYLWLYHKGKRKGEMLELYQKPLSEVPIKKISMKEQKPFIDLVDKILAITKDEDYLQNETKKAQVKELERQIDQLVYKLYNLTDEEIEIIEKN